jgi:hypothetical protein
MPWEQILVYFRSALGGVQPERVLMSSVRTGRNSSLLVEDDPDLRQLLQEVIERLVIPQIAS